MKSGYVRIRVNNAYVYEHRYIMEKSLGRSLHKLEHVHHRSENKSDNKRENLKLLDKRKHDKIGTIKRWKDDPDSFKPDKDKCLKPRIERHGRGKLCQRYAPCSYHPD